jgi:hypothetical protein
VLHAATPPVPRKELHARAITLRGYNRDDGLFDIEARLVDTKPFPLPNQDRGRIPAGEPLHEMGVRLTLDHAMRIVAAEAATDHAPYAVCPQAAPNFARLVGLQVRRGFFKEAMQRVGGAAGCTHLRELLQQMATVAFQTIGPARARQELPHAKADELDTRISEHFGGAERMLNTCLAYAANSPVVRRRWPHLFSAADSAA